uniref:Uncharacterized protein n=1 Tax=Nelumbo nucifera TaxID=4432 RepID=A0A822ZQ06_NELNU|nr:TPA_asm: hypothetical protein HUJ06_016850 [Nelumbo nucifera]
MPPEQPPSSDTTPHPPLPRLYSLASRLSSFLYLSSLSDSISLPPKQQPPSMAASVIGIEHRSPATTISFVVAQCLKALNRSASPATMLQQSSINGQHCSLLSHSHRREPTIATITHSHLAHCQEPTIAAVNPLHQVIDRI